MKEGDKENEIITAENKGIKQGIKQGFKQGVKDNQTETALKMLNKNMAINVIAEITELTENEILNLKK